jgi:hypothetical protein
METSIATALKAQRVSVLLSKLPSWVDKTTCVLSEPRSDLKLTFYCCCALNKQQISVRKGSGSSEEEHALKLRAAVERWHQGCQPTVSEAVATSSTLPTERERQLEGEVVTLKRKLRKADSAADLQAAKAAKHAAAQKVLTESKRQERREDNRTLEIDPEKKEELDADGKSFAMTSHHRGIIKTIKYWARGSMAAVLQLVMALICHFQLQGQVAAELGVQQNETNEYIVERLGDSLRILKQCRNEEQRQHFRVVLTALAPAKIGQRRRGMSRRVAKALRINRNSKPFRDSVAKRAEIDEAAKSMNDPVVVGDSVVTRHGAGTLVDCGDRPEDPCCVEIQIGDSFHVSKFTRMDNGEGGGRVRREPISFAHGSRAARKDQVTDDIKDKVTPLTAPAPLSQPCSTPTAHAPLSQPCSTLTALLHSHSPCSTLTALLHSHSPAPLSQPSSSLTALLHSHSPAYLI